MTGAPTSPPPVPRYGRASLGDLTASLVSALGVGGFANPLGLDPVEGAGLLVLDGFGWDLLRSHPEHAPFLWAASEGTRPITAGFPATTATSLASIGTALPPGDHGLVGYAVAVPGHDRAMNLLQWELYGSGPQVSLRGEFPPEAFQPRRTAFEAAASDGVDVSLVGPPHLARSPLERAALRGGRYHGAHSLGDLVTATARRLSVPGRRLVYAYHPGLDTTGHVRGCGSEAWALELTNVDRLAMAIVERLTPGSVLVVTGDHGMVDLPEAGRLDLGDVPDLAVGVRLLAGEGRARHVHVWEGAEEDVLAAWRAVLGDRMWVAAGEEAIAGGWFGPTVSDLARARIGDVVAAAREPFGVFQRSVDAMQPRFHGHHGSMTPAEQLVPMLVFSGGGGGSRNRRGEVESVEGSVTTSRGMPAERQDR